MRTAEVLAAVLQPALALVHESTPTEYETIILPTFRFVQRTIKLLATSNRTHHRH